MNAPRVFDAKVYESLNNSRAAVVSRLLGEVKDKLDLRTAIDVGCGLGYFSGLLDSLGFQVTGVDGRKENAEESRRRFPKIQFHECSVEDPGIHALGKFDLVFCFGLLYHLENPLLAIRNLRKLCSTLLLVESVIFPGAEPVMGLVDEGHTDDQGLNYVAFYPTESCLVKMMFRAGFPQVCRFPKMPDHADFRPPGKLRRVRTMLAASVEPTWSLELVTLTEPTSLIQPWDPRSGIPDPSAMEKFRRFVSKPLPEKVKLLKRVGKRPK